MRLTVIGCGTAVPDAERVASGYLVETAGACVLLDCGPGVVHGLARANAPWPHLTHVALTHFHNDHIGDIPALFFALKHGLRPKREAPLRLLGPPGTAALVRALPDALGAHVRDPGFPLDVVEIAGDEVLDLGGARLHVYRTAHAESSVAYRVERDGAGIGYTGDTGPDDALARRLAGCDVLVCECSLPEDEEMPSHLTPTTAARFARIAQPGLLVLTHAYPQLDRGTLAAHVERAGWKGETRIAFDGLVLDV